MFKDLSISKRLIIGFGLLIMILIVTNLMAMKRMAETMDNMDLLVNERVLKIKEANNINERTLSIGRSLRGILIADSREEREAIKAEIHKLRELNGPSLATLEKLIHSPEGKALLSKIVAVRDKAGPQYEQYFNIAERDLNEAKTYIKTELTPTMNGFLETTHAMVEFQELLMHQAVEKDRAAYASGRNMNIGILIVATLFAVGLAYWIIASISGPLSSMRQIIQRVRDNKDFTQSIPVVGRNEVGLTALAFNDLLATMRETLGGLRQATNRIDDASQQLANGAQQSARASEDASESASSMAASVEQVSVSINHVAANAGDALQMARRSGELSDQGGAVIGEAVDEMKVITAAVKNVALQIDTLGQQSTQISGVVQVIKDVADQTNLLALNEAARAGEAGRGFAVVADEVRKLAERTTQATGEIAAMIASIQNSAKTAVGSMENVVTQAESGMSLAEQAGHAIIQIRESANDVVRVVSDITEAIAEQGSASQSIAQQVERVAQSAEENHGAAQSTADSASELGRLARTMREDSDRFVIA